MVWGKLVSVAGPRTPLSPSPAPPPHFPPLLIFSSHIHFITHPPWGGKWSSTQQRSCRSSLLQCVFISSILNSHSHADIPSGCSTTYRCVCVQCTISCPLIISSSPLMLESWPSLQRINLTISFTDYFRSPNNVTDTHHIHKYQRIVNNLTVRTLCYMYSTVSHTLFLQLLSSHPAVGTVFHLTCV